MKNYALLIAFGIGVSACDKIDTPLEPTQAIENNIAWDDTSYALLNNNFKIVLFEEFTGHTCQQCPAGNTLLKNLSEQHPGRICIASIHAGFFAETQNNANGSFATDHSCPEGQEYASTFGVINNPVALVNRLPYNNNTLLGMGNWEPAFTSISSQTPIAAIAMTTLYDDSSRTIQVSSRFEWTSFPASEVRYQLYLLEDSIVDWQKDGGTSIENYTHNHLLRASLNGTWGSPVVNQDSTYTYQIKASSNWTSSNLEVVGFLYNAATYEIYQVNKTKVRP